MKDEERVEHRIGNRRERTRNGENGRGVKNPMEKKGRGKLV